MAQFVRVTDDEGEEAMEIPTEEDGCDTDGTLLLSSLIAQFPGACGLKYRSETGGLRGVRLAEGSLYPPNGSWGNTIYIINYPKAESKRKVDEELEYPVSTKMKKIETRKCSDLIVLGLPWKSTEEDMEQYFKQFGDLILTQVKRDPRTGQSKGFGFIRFKDYDSQLRCLAGRHRIDGRWCEVNLPNSHAESGSMSTNRKIFVARCTEDLTTDDLREYFEQYGEVVDVFIPKPFRAFAFVTFADPVVAEKLCGEDHIIKGASVHISSAEPKGKDSSHGDRHGGASGRGSSNRSRNPRDEPSSWGGSSRQPEAMPNEPSMNNIGMNMLSSAMLAAAQAVFSGHNQNNPSENYQLGPGFGGTRDSRSGQSGGGYTSGSSWGGDSSTPSQSNYSNWSNRSGTASNYTPSNTSQWGTGTQNRGGWN